MQQYANSSRTSGVRAFHTESNLTGVHLSDGGVYTYTYASTGSGNVEHMKMLAHADPGLNSFITRNVKK